MNDFVSYLISAELHRKTIHNQHSDICTCIVRFLWYEM